MKSLIKEINAKLEPLVANGEKDKAKVAILFHCYGGKNRSGAAACGFIWWYKNKKRAANQEGGSGDGTTMGIF